MSELRGRLDLHYTPKHGNWLNIAEIELSVFKRHCLCRRSPDMKTLSREVEVWTGDLPQKMYTSNSKDYTHTLKLDKTLAPFYELRIILENNKKLEV